MRVTKLIKDYVTKTVNQAIPLEGICPEYDRIYNLCDEGIDAMNEKIESYAKQLVEDFKAKNALPDDWKFEYRVGRVVTFSSYSSELSQEHSRLCNKARNRREKAIESVLLDMELGEVSKQTLADAISKAIEE